MNLELINKMHETISAMGVVLNEVASDRCHGRKAMNERWCELERMMKEMNKPPATITAEDVRSLRERTGEGLMACKKALTASKGNIENAVEYLRTSGHISCYTDQNRPAIGAR